MFLARENTLREDGRISMKMTLEVDFLSFKQERDRLSRRSKEAVLHRLGFCSVKPFAKSIRFLVATEQQKDEENLTFQHFSRKLAHKKVRDCSIQELTETTVGGTFSACKCLKHVSVPLKKSGSFCKITYRKLSHIARSLFPTLNKIFFSKDTDSSQLDEPGSPLWFPVMTYQFVYEQQVPTETEGRVQELQPIDSLRFSYQNIYTLSFALVKEARKERKG